VVDDYGALIQSGQQYASVIAEYHDHSANLIEFFLISLEGKSQGLLWVYEDLQLDMHSENYTLDLLEAE
jgi:hypothetical protein